MRTKACTVQYVGTIQTVILYVLVIFFQMVLLPSRANSIKSELSKVKKVLGFGEAASEDDKEAEEEKAGKETHQSRKLRSFHDLSPCPKHPPGLLGSLLVRQSLPGPEPLPGSEDFVNWFGDVEEGGRFAPGECQPRRELAVVIPYR